MFNYVRKYIVTDVIVSKKMYFYQANESITITDLFYAKVQFLKNKITNDNFSDVYFYTYRPSLQEFQQHELKLHKQETPTISLKHDNVDLKGTLRKISNNEILPKVTQR